MEECVLFSHVAVGFVPEVCSIFRPVIVVEFLLCPSASIESLSVVQVA